MALTVMGMSPWPVMKMIGMENSYAIAPFARKSLPMQPPLRFRFTDGMEVRRLGYGAMRLTGQPGNFGPYETWDEGKKVLQRAVELGINFIDTARAYGPGWNERLIAEALHPYPEGLFIATKGGVVKKSAKERYLDGSHVSTRLRRKSQKLARRLHRLVSTSLGRSRCAVE